MAGFRIDLLFSAVLLPLLLIMLLTYLSVKTLKRKGMTVVDAHKEGHPQVPRPGGPAIAASLVFSELLIFWSTGDSNILSVALTIAVAAVVGLMDDFFVLGGSYKPMALILASLPILLLGTYSFRPVLPLFGAVRLSIVYPLLVLISMPVVANTFNSIDVLNGAVSGFAAIVIIPVIFALALKGSDIVLIGALPLLVTSLGFYYFHRHPSKIFPGDSGSLAFGAAYGALAIVGGTEVVAVVAILPAIMNSFFFLSSVKRIIEHRRLKERPVIFQKDQTLAASKEASAPITLVRLILAEGPLSERSVTMVILKLAIFCSLLAAVTALLTWGIRLA